MTRLPKTSPTDHATTPTKFMQKGERNKFIIMSVVLVVVVVAFFATQMQEAKHRDADLGEIAEEPAFVESVAVEAFDMSPLEGKISDTRPRDRVLLPAETLDPFLHYPKGFGDAHFKALGVRDLDESTLAPLMEAPSAHRAEAYRVRGYLEDVKSRERPDGLTEYKGWVRMPDKTVVHFVVTEMVERVILYDFVRIDGLFVKLFRREVHDGTMAEGPLLVGAKVVRSVPPCEPYDEKVLRDRLVKISDDTATGTTGLDPLTLEAQWLLMNYAASPEGAEIDWESVPEFDNLTMTEVLKNGKQYRGKPFRIPISRSQGVRTVSAGENPLRLDEVTTGWIGNMMWTNQAGVVRFILPEPHPELEGAPLVSGHGFFLKNHGYEPKNGGIHLAPYFVMTSLEEFIPTESTLTRDVMIGVASLALLLFILFPILLMRDRRKSEALQRDLVRRRQERRRKLAEEDQS
jgi:hypothetical protein